ncbi:ECF-type sigma factor [Gimesia panareensis]|uniref:RNA polymerase sigma factor n=1 Tax=Gimesia panareensis TaxID=2527978 RepID=A0A518A8K5_9PLAN|nr:ECF-type sigma factor [Gimesia panareensis]QDT28157.1 RNA polymerase sigma factor [Gimesia panareensis]QDU51024.1 RNA polymerase sigma factor [Gimesia panareensis]
MSLIEETVTQWIDQLKTGDADAAQRLWESYFLEMVEVARKKLQGAPRAVADEEDVALSAFKSFCLGAQNGRFSQVTDRENLWPLLVAITSHKSVDLIRQENRKKRGGSGASGTDSERKRENKPVDFEEIIQHQPSPEFTVQLAEELERLLDLLDKTGDSTLRQVALAKMEGETTTEIAEQLSCARRTVERKLQLITRLWQEDCNL